MGIVIITTMQEGCQNLLEGIITLQYRKTHCLKKTAHGVEMIGWLGEPAPHRIQVELGDSDRN